jgi:uncharacterized 2Fe-2S/4Fe-4S cluster protein (DUF4445 family)
MPSVHFILQDVTVSVARGTRLLDAARLAGLAIETPCDGLGNCGKCRAKRHDPLRGNLREEPHDLLSAAEHEAGWILACQTTVLNDAAIEVQASLSEELSILSEGQAADVAIEPWIKKVADREANRTRVLAGDALLASESGDTTALLYGLAVDIGTTTLVAALNDLGSGREIAVASSLNPQARHAQDVLSRIKLGSKAEGLRMLHRELIEELNGLIGELRAQTGIKAEHIYEAVFSGNTTMLHLAAAVNPAGLGKHPYIPAMTGANHIKAADLGLAIAPAGLVYLPPIVSAYVGADITAGVLATRLSNLRGVTLFVDVGTNGEMVLAVDGRLTATSTAAGPAFEGMNIACGMRAGRGAIERVTFSETGLEIGTIGQAEPVGICGSGLLDAVGEMAAHHALDKRGRFHANGQPESRPWKEFWDSLDGALIFRLAGPVYLSQKDIRQVQLAKAAIRAGIDLMLKANNLTAAQVDRVLIAGSFGFHLRTRSLIHLGLLPQEFADRVKFVGNTSKTGAQALLLNRRSRDELQRIVSGVRVIELANDPAFERAFIQSLSF